MKQVFDENSFNFTLDGSEKHSDVVIASAFMKKGEMAGMPVPLNCTWYRVSGDPA